MNGQWVPAQEFTDGDNVRVEINYSLGAGAVGADNKTIHYQLPQGITLAQQESGTVYDGSTAVGQYTITENGYIEITFDDDFADESAFNGTIRFEGQVWANNDGSDNEISFGTGGSITVKPPEKPTDVSVSKSGEYSKGDGKLHYTVTVSTNQGTGGAITVNDSFGFTDTSATYDRNSFQIFKVVNGQKTPVSDYELTITDGGWEGAPEKFTITGLPALAAGEKYEISYTATPGESSSATGESSVSNNVNISVDGGGSSNSSSNVVISRQMLKKYGEYNQSTGVIKWTITVNPDGREIGGWELTDQVTAPDGGTVTMPDTVNISPEVNGQSQIKLPYTFPAGASDTYTITYETKVEDLQPGQQVTMYNRAELEGDGERYEGSSTVHPNAPDYGLHKGGWLDTSSSTETTGKVQWNASINVPGTFEAENLESITFTDTLKGATTGEMPVPDSHYMTGEQLDAMTVRVDGSDLERGTDCVICDKDGNPITGFGEDDRYTGFRIEFKPSAVNKVRGKTISMQYYSTVDYTKLEAGPTYTIFNTGEIPGHEADASVIYKKPDQLKKQAGDKGWQGSNGYNGHFKDGVTVDYEASEGILHFRILLSTNAGMDGQNIVLTDRLPKRATLIEDTLRAQYRARDSEYYDWDGQPITAGEPAQNPDGTTSVTFTIENFEYNPGGPELSIYYDVSIKNDSIWTDDPGLESHIYHNEVSWGSESAGVDFTVNRDVPELEKSGEQLLDEQGKPTDTVRYYIVINPAEKDLVHGIEYITLTDKLNYGSAAGAELLPSSVKLYSYDADKPENHYCGAEVNPSLYSYTYDEEQHVLVFNLLDQTAYVLVYEYVIDRGSAAVDFNITNEVHLQGGDSSGEKNEIQFSNTSSGATATKLSLTIYKVDATNYGKLLPSAQFTLECYQNGAWLHCAYLKTDDEGKIVLDRADDEQFVNFNFEDGVLYRLTETAAPQGYTVLDSPHHFVWVPADSTADKTKEEMKNSGALDGVASETVQFLTTSGSIYVPNEPSTLSVKKLWYSEDGAPLDPGDREIKVNLIQQAVQSNAVKVTVKSTGNESWSQTHQAVANVAAGSSVTIRINVNWNEAAFSVYENDVKKATLYHEQGYITYTTTVSADTTIEVTYGGGSTYENIQFLNYTTPTFVPVGEAKVYDTVTLSAENKWTHTWQNLPKTDGGNRLYYHVEEIAVPGFEVIYSSNNSDGVQAGELVIINRSNGYVLPETGGAGTARLAVAGTVLMALAALTYLSLRRKGAEKP